jgi:hypothetical protein
MTAAELRFLSILSSELVADAVEQLHVALLRVLLHRCDEGPRHSARSLSSDGGISPVTMRSACIHTR